MNKLLALVSIFIFAGTLAIQANAQQGQASTSRNLDPDAQVEDEHDHAEESHNDEDEHAEEEGEHEEEEHEHEEEGEHAEEEGAVSISPGQASIANIAVAELRPQVMQFEVYAPGEIKANGYTSYHLSPRVESLVLRRHVTLGDHVEAEEPLVTLFSETVANAQASFRVATSELSRVTQLGRETVGEGRFVEAQNDYDAALGRLIAFGLSQSAIDSLGEGSLPLGEYTLRAPGAGLVLSDDFRQGEWVVPGTTLIELVDEAELWVEARLSPAANLDLSAGTKARVVIGGSSYLAAVAQEAHTIDPITRTRVVRLLINNDQHTLHPGMFVDVYFNFSTDTEVLAVPEAALMRSSDGDWTVFTEQETGVFAAHEVELGRSFGERREIAGIDPYTRIVMEGAFFVASQIAKGGFDPHNH